MDTVADLASDLPAALLDVVDVHLARGGRPLLSGVSLTVRAGEHWALLGANGAGKTTLLGICGAQTHPTRGTVRVLGGELGRVDVRELRSHLGHVNPRHPVSGPLRVRDVVLTGATGTNDLVPRWAPTDAQLAHAAELIELLGIGHIAEERWPTLSQGERGRALIARALMPEPKLLLLDEPATGLDVAAREQLVDAIATLARTRPDLASVLVSHHFEELPPTTTHAVLLRHGAVVAAGPAAQVLTTEHVSDAFEYPLTLSRVGERWTAHADSPSSGQLAV